MRQFLKRGSDILVLGMPYTVEFATDEGVRAVGLSNTIHMEAATFDELLSRGDVEWAVPAQYSDRINIDPILGCWVWVGELNRNGYGTFITRPQPGIRKRKMAHIETYVAVIGEYDRRLFLDHKCRNRPCCNPAHLEPVTVRVNTLRGEAVLFKPSHWYKQEPPEKYHD